MLTDISPGIVPINLQFMIDCFTQAPIMFLYIYIIIHNTVDRTDFSVMPCHCSYWASAAPVTSLFVLD